MGSRPGSTQLVKQLRNVFFEFRELIGHGIPYQAIVQFRIAMYQNIAETDDIMEVTHARLCSGIELAQLVQRLADDLELPLHRRAKHQVGYIVVVGSFLTEPTNPPCGLQHVV